MRILGSIFRRPAIDRFLVTDPEVLNRFLGNPDFPWLISFPRTGSHWLRMIMELYFGKPSLRRAFFYPNATDFTCYHWHDVDLTTQGVKSVLYLYRDPVDTIYSTLRYHKEDVTRAQRVRYWTGVYARHLTKWMFEESSATRKTVIRYEGLRTDPAREFRAVCAHIGVPMDENRLRDAMAQVSKDRLKELTRHDDQVVDLSRDYDAQREEFRALAGRLVMEALATVDSRLPELWPATDTAL